jgi:hypothetical protein
VLVIRDSSRSTSFITRGSGAGLVGLPGDPLEKMLRSD